MIHSTVSIYELDSKCGRVPCDCKTSFRNCHIKYTTFTMVTIRWLVLVKIWILYLVTRTSTAASNMRKMSMREKGNGQVSGNDQEKSQTMSMNGKVEVSLKTKSRNQ
jgi:hypothetical protein